LRRQQRAQQAQGAIGLLKGMAQEARGQQSVGSGPEGEVSAVSAAPLPGVGSAPPMA
jgi:hypothetical protein